MTDKDFLDDEDDEVEVEEEAFEAPEEEKQRVTPTDKLLKELIDRANTRDRMFDKFETRIRKFEVLGFPKDEAMELVLRKARKKYGKKSDLVFLYEIWVEKYYSAIEDAIQSAVDQVLNSMEDDEDED